MAKFPINLLLYLITLGLLGGSGFYFYEAVNLPRQPDHAKNRDLAMEAITRGKGQKPIVAGEDYGEDRWQNFASANFTGKLPPKKPDKVEKKDDEPAQVNTQTPLEDIFAIQGIYYDAADSRVILRYKPTANVQPPADEMKKRIAQQTSSRNPPGARGGRPASGVRGNPRNKRGGNRGAQPSSLTSSHPNDGMVHHLSLEDAEKSALWAPYQNIRLVSVSADAEYAVFQREEPGKEAEDWAELKMFKAVLDLSPEILELLHGDSKVGTGLAPRQQTQAAKPANPDNPWQPTPVTKSVGRGTWDIGEEELSHIRDDSARVFNEDIGFASYSGRGGRKGLRLTKISPRFQSFGFQVGDIITHLNDQPVSSKSAAITLGKKLYQRGVRTFRVKVLTGRGYTEERVYNAPN